MHVIVSTILVMESMPSDTLTQINYKFGEDQYN